MSHFWIEIPLRLENQIIQIKTLVCDSEFPYNIVLGHTSLAQLLAWQDYVSRQLFIAQISIPLMAMNNIRVLPGHTGIISLVLKPSKTSFIPHHMIIGKGIANVKPFDLTLPLRPVEIEFENNRCCLEVCNTSDCTIEPATLSPKPITYDKPIDPSEMPHISTCTEMTTEDTNVPTQDDKYLWLDPNDKQ